IRESGVMSFPALWEASARVGAVAEPRTPMINSSDLDFPTLDDKEDEGAKTVHNSRSPFDGSQDQGLEDVEMDDMRGIFTNGSEESNYDDDTLGLNENKKRNQSIDSAPPTPTPSMTTIKDQVILQTTEFAINGGFRSRVVAVQIIQSLLDYGISVAE